MKYIKFAGLVSEWTIEYASSYAEKLFELGFYAKSIELNGKKVVAYGNYPFTRLDIDKEVLKMFSEGNGAK